jgi:hypothetical protein
MLPHMIARIVLPTGYAGTRSVAVSLPLVPFLVVDMPERYSLPGAPAVAVPRADVRPTTPPPVSGRHRRHKTSHSDARMIERWLERAHLPA